MNMRGFLAVLVLVVIIVYAIIFVKTGQKSRIQEDVNALSRMNASLTNTMMITLGREIESFAAGEGRVPASLQEFLQRHPVTTGLFDAWGTETKYERVSDEHFRLISAGRDRKFGTPDDIVREF